MTYTPTNRPVPSDAPEDLYFNSSLLDRYANSLDLSVVDRNGVSRKTIFGIEQQVISIVQGAYQVFYPDAYGAIGISVAQDTAAIQAALNAAAAANGEVRGRPGVNYQISSLRIRNGVRKVDFSQSLITPDASTAAVTTGAIQVDGPYRLGGATVSRCKVTVRLDMQNGGRCGIYSDGSQFCDFSDSEIFGFTDHPTINHYGILFWYSSSGNWVSKNKLTLVQNPTQRGLAIDFIGQGDAFAGYFVNSGATTRASNPCLYNVVVENECIYGSYGINLLGTESSVFLGNICRGQNHRSIYLAESCAYNLIANNVCQDFLSTAVLLGYGCIENEVIANICKREPGVQAPGTGEAAINITTGARRNKIKANKIYADTNYGIYQGCNMQHNSIEENEVRGYYIAGIALETDWEAIADRPAGAIYSRPNYATPGSVAPGATRWAYGNADSVSIVRNIIREGSPGRSVAAIYICQVDSNSNLSLIKCNILGNEVFGNADMAHYLYVFEETSGRLVNCKLSGNRFTDTSGVASAAKIFISRGRMHFNYYRDNDVIDDVVTTFTSGDTTPSVAYGARFAFNNASPTSVTTFDDAPPGLLIEVRLGANTTLVHDNAMMRLSGAANISGRTTNDTIILRNQSTGTTPLWVEIDRSFSLDVVGSLTYDPPSIAAGASAAEVSVTVTGAVLGDPAVASFSLDLAGLTISAYVSAANTVKVRLTNPTADAIDLASGTLRARAIK